MYTLLAEKNVLLEPLTANEKGLACDWLISDKCELLLSALPWATSDPDVPGDIMKKKGTRFSSIFWTAHDYAVYTHRLLMADMPEKEQAEGQVGHFGANNLPGHLRSACLWGIHRLVERGGEAIAVAKRRMGAWKTQGSHMSLETWFETTLIIRFLKVDDLRKEVADLRSQLNAMGNTVSEQARETQSLRELLDKRTTAFGDDLTEVERRNGAAYRARIRD